HVFLYFAFFVSPPAALRDLHSFPTRRSSDLSLRGLGRPLTQQELASAMKREIGRGLSQAYLSQIESGARPHLTHKTRDLLARFRSEEHTSELQSPCNLVCRLLLEKKKQQN